MSFLYDTVIGRIILKVLCAPPVSRFAGFFLDSSCSKFLIKPFIRKNYIDMSDYEHENYRSFNSFFCRQIKPKSRPIDMVPADLISPCDGLLSIYNINSGKVFPVKQVPYTVKDLLRNDELASEYEDGLCLVFRLCVDNFHKYCYLDNGSKGENIHINGVLHTVRPYALRTVPVFRENSREYTVLQTENFGTVIQMEVGALLVGKIDNYHGSGPIRRGQEKGRFMFGGSTIILLLKKDCAKIDQAYFAASDEGVEIPVKMGSKLGVKAG